MKIIDIKNTSVKIYRQYSLKKNTPEILKTIYVERKGSLLELNQKFGKEEVQKNLYSSYIRTLSDNTWQVTECGIDNIKIFHSRHGLFKTIKSVLFGLMSRPFH